jgi:hypothetical protein
MGREEDQEEDGAIAIRSPSRVLALYLYPNSSPPSDSCLCTVIRRAIEAAEPAAMVGKQAFLDGDISWDQDEVRSGCARMAATHAASLAGRSRHRG